MLFYVSVIWVLVKYENVRGNLSTFNKTYLATVTKSKVGDTSEASTRTRLYNRGMLSNLGEVTLIKFRLSSFSIDR